MECRIARGCISPRDGPVVTERKSLIGRGRLSATLLTAAVYGGIIVLPVANAKAYNSLWQFKADAWSSLEDAAVELSVASAGKRSLERAVDTATELLDVLGPIERLYAYPGTQEFSKVRRMFAAGKYDQFAAMMGEINRAFVTDSFRTGQVRHLGREDHASDRDTHPGSRPGGVGPISRS